MNVIYDFNGRLKKEFPSQVIIDITERCNYACVHCPHSILQESSRYTAADLNFETVRKIVDEVSVYGKGFCQQIRFASDGEPFLNKEVYEMLSYAVEKSKTFVSITTNGSTLTSENIKRLLDTKVSLVDVSLDAYTEETYNKIRIGGNFTKVTNGVKELILKRNMLGYNTKIVVSYVKQQLNYEETDMFKEYWERKGVDYVVIRDIHTAGGAKLENDVQIKEENRRPCVYPWERICVSPTAKYGFCPASWEGKSEIGDCMSDNIRELWNSDKYRRLREMHLSNCFEDEHMCSQCKDWVTTAWPNSNRKGYGDMIEELTRKGDM